MPFGLCNVPATFERLTESILRGLTYDACLEYLDEVIVISRTFQEQLDSLRELFQRLRDAHLKLNPEKCPAIPEGGTIPGLYRFAVRSDYGSREAGSCEELTKTNDKHKLRSFLRLCTYCRRFISGFADMAKTLTRLTEEKRIFEWSTETETAFQALKDALCTAPVLGYPRPGDRFIVDTDASNVRIGGVLSQEQDDSERVVAYFSKILSKAESNFCVTRRKLLAIAKTLENFHNYLYGQEFHLRADHSALTRLLSFRNLEGHTARGVQRLQKYNFTSEHRQGIRHTKADVLSRRTCPEESLHFQTLKNRQAAQGCG
jgi:hypothetical protein